MPGLRESTEGVLLLAEGRRQEGVVRFDTALAAGEVDPLLRAMMQNVLPHDRAERVA